MTQAPLILFFVAAASLSPRVDPQAATPIFHGVRVIARAAVEDRAGAEAHPQNDSITARRWPSESVVHDAGGRPRLPHKPPQSSGLTR